MQLVLSQPLFTLSRSREVKFLPAYPNPWAVMVMAAANTDADAYREVPAATAGSLLSFDFHKPAAVNFSTIVQLLGRILIGNDFVAVEVGIGSFIIAEHFIHLLEGGLIISIKPQHLCVRQRDDELLAQ